MTGGPGKTSLSKEQVQAYARSAAEVLLGMGQVARAFALAGFDEDAADPRGWLDQPAGWRLIAARFGRDDRQRRADDAIAFLLSAGVDVDVLSEHAGLLRRCTGERLDRVLLCLRAGLSSAEVVAAVRADAWPDPAGLRALIALRG